VTPRESALAALDYGGWDRLPLAHFGFWRETLDKWVAEGRLRPEEIEGIGDGSPRSTIIGKKLGFDFNWGDCYPLASGLFPPFSEQILRVREDGMEEVRNADGAIVLRRPGAVSIPAEIGHTLMDRASWEAEFLPRLAFDESRIDAALLASMPLPAERSGPLGLYCGSLYGIIRNWLGVEGLSYLTVDDPGLHREIVDTVGGLVLSCVRALLARRSDFDCMSFWEDICFKNGPLVVPSQFRELVGPWYRKICAEAEAAGIRFRYVDCDGFIEDLVPTWIDDGVNLMFPIEYGTWKGSIASLREKFGPALRGVGGMDKSVFGRDRDAVDAEIGRLRPLVDLGGYLPCPDHQIPPDAEWDLVRYYCDRFREAFRRGA
jgi:uroporphyrinogen decarboxylase